MPSRLRARKRTWGAVWPRLVSKVSNPSGAGADGWLANTKELSNRQTRGSDRSAFSMQILRARSCIPYRGCGSVLLGKMYAPAALLYLSIITIYLIPNAWSTIICAGLDVPGTQQEAFWFEDDEPAEDEALAAGF